MPEMGGKECCEALLRIYSSLKVVMASGYALSAAKGKVSSKLGAEGINCKTF